jgi:hypothetical protein
MVVRLGHLKPRLRRRCSKARSSSEQEEQEPGHLERLKNSSQLPVSIQKGETQRDGAAWSESARARVANLAACRELDIRSRNLLRSGDSVWSNSCKVAFIVIVWRPVGRGEEFW